MGDSGLLKSALFFLCLAAVVLLFMPKDCAQKAAQPLAALKRTKTTTAPKGLRIETSTPEPAKHEVPYPAGLDAARLQYLIEIDNRFAAPKMLVCPKQPSGGAIGSATLVQTLQSLHYLETKPDGTYGFTSEGLIKASPSDDGSAWNVPVAKRQFVRVDEIDCTSADQCNVKFTWQWQPNEIGQAMQPQLDPHTGTAKIIGGPGGWVLTDVGGVDAVF